MIYVASPYSHPDPAVREGRYLFALRYTAGLLSSGRLCFSPIAYGHQFHRRFSLGMDFHTWKPLNDFMLSQATEVHVLALPGWELSAGIMHEIAFAGEHEIPYRVIRFEDISLENL